MRIFSSEVKLLGTVIVDIDEKTSNYYYYYYYYSDDGKKVKKRKKLILHLKINLYLVLKIQ